MVKVPAKEREAIFRGIVGSDKWTPGLRRQSKGGADDGTDEDEAPPAEEESDDGNNRDVDGNVILFYMELHPKAPGLGLV
jgi:hypothetical protein